MKSFSKNFFNRAIIKLHYECNNNCIFCHTYNNKKYKSNFKEIIKKISKAKELGINQIIFSGGEPTIYPKLKELINYVKKNFSIGFITNGRMFYYENFIKYLISNKSKYFYISFHSYNEKNHDNITKSKNSWNQTLEGIQKLLKYSTDLEIIINYVLTKYNLMDIPKTIELLKTIGVKNIKFSFPEPKGKVLDNNYSILPDIQESGKAINIAMDLSKKLGLNCFYDGVPYCYVKKDYRTKVNNLERSRIFYMSEVYENNFFKTDEGIKQKEIDCIFCSFDDVCQGFYKGYKGKIKYELKPFIEKIPNYIPLYKIKKTNNNYKNQFYFKKINLINNNKLTQYEMKSNYFKIYNLSKLIKQDLLYYNSIKDLNLADLYKIKKINLNNYKIDTRNIFFNNDNYIFNKLKKIDGNVLEVGFGDLFFENIFFNYLKNKIIYHGIDPDEQKYKKAIKKYSNNIFFNSYIENFKYKENYFNYIILTGSYCHLKNFKESFINIKKLLKKDGILIIIENKLFGILFSKIFLKNVIEQNEYNKKYLEHYRNDSVDKASIILKRLSFSIIEKYNSKISPFWMIIASCHN